MAARPSEPWSFEDGPEVADRVLREYARWRLDTLPHLPDALQPTAELLEGYRRLDTARDETVRRLHATTDPGLTTVRAMLQREACIAWSVWEVLHRYLVAAEFNRLQTSGNSVDELQLVLLAERNVEQLTSDIEKAA